MCGRMLLCPFLDDAADAAAACLFKKNLRTFLKKNYNYFFPSLIGIQSLIFCLQGFVGKSAQNKNGPLLSRKQNDF